MAESVQCRVLRHAARVVGGYAELQARLDASREEMISWIRGVQVPPVATFVRLVELLLDAGELGRAADDARERPRVAVTPKVA